MTNTTNKLSAQMLAETRPLPFQTPSKKAQTGSKVI